MHNSLEFTDSLLWCVQFSKDCYNDDHVWLTKARCIKYMITHNMPLQKEGDKEVGTSTKVSQGPSKSKKRNKRTKENSTKEEPIKE